MRFIQDVTVNPELPIGSLLAWNICAIAVAGIVIVALISIYRHRGAMQILQAAMWLAVVLLAPLLGSLVWLVIGRPRYDVTAERAVGRTVRK